MQPHGKRRWAIAAAAVLALAPARGSALTINFTTIAGDSLTAEQLAGFETAASIWESLLTNPVTVTISVGFTSLGSNILGQTTPAEYITSYSTVRSDLITNNANATAVANLPASVSGGSVVATAANLLALGYNVTGSDGSIVFSNSYAFQYARNGNGGVTSGYYDFVGIALHEIAHLLGFVSDVGTTSTVPTILDLYRYTPGSTTLSFGSGLAADFSIDGGTTDIAAFSDGSTYQASHWSNNSDLLMQPALAAGNVQNITATDLLAMEALGWDVAVPEPGTVALFATALLGLFGLRRRADQAPA